MARTKAFNPDEVLQKAMHIFWQKGYHATSMQDLVDGLGLSRSSIYDTYGGKEQLYEAALQRYLKLNKDGFKESMVDIKTLAQAMLYSVVKDVSEQDCKGCFAVNVSIEMGQDADMGKILELVHTQKEGMLKILESMMKDDPKAINTAYSHREASLLLYNTMVGMRVLARSGSSAEELKEIAGGMLRNLFSE